MNPITANHVKAEASQSVEQDAQHSQPTVAEIAKKVKPEPGDTTPRKLQERVVQVEPETDNDDPNSLIEEFNGSRENTPSLIGKSRSPSPDTQAQLAILNRDFLRSLKFGSSDSLNSSVPETPPPSDESQVT